MAAWILVPCLARLRTEFNLVAPGRDKGADGAIGDSSHTSSSDHTPDEDSDILRDHDADAKSEVHAVDIDSTGPWPEPGWFDQAIKALVARERAEFESATVVGRLKYVIWNRRIAERSNGWVWRAYTGADPHTNHAHFSARYTTAQEADTRPWGLLEDDDMNAAEMTAWAKSAAGREALGVAGGIGVHDQVLGKSKVTFGQATQGTYAAVAAGFAADAARDASAAAGIAQLTALVHAMASSGGAFTEAQIVQLKQTMREAAAAAGDAASARVASKVDALRRHLGDDEPA